MTSLAWLIPVALVLGGFGLAAFLWSLKNGQYDDLDGAAWRAVMDDEPRRGAAKAAADAEAAVAAPASAGQAGKPG